MGDKDTGSPTVTLTFVVLRTRAENLESSLSDTCLHGRGSVEGEEWSRDVVESPDPLCLSAVSGSVGGKEKIGGVH